MVTITGHIPQFFQVTQYTTSESCCCFTNTKGFFFNSAASTSSEIIFTNVTDDLQFWNHTYCLAAYVNGGNKASNQLCFQRDTNVTKPPVPPTPSPTQPLGNWRGACTGEWPDPGPLKNCSSGGCFIYGIGESLGEVFLTSFLPGNGQNYFFVYSHEHVR